MAAATCDYCGHPLPNSMPVDYCNNCGEPPPKKPKPKGA